MRLHFPSLLLDSYFRPPSSYYLIVIPISPFPPWPSPPPVLTSSGSSFFHLFCLLIVVYYYSLILPFLFPSPPLPFPPFYPGFFSPNSLGLALVCSLPLLCAPAGDTRAETSPRTLRDPVPWSYCTRSLSRRFPPDKVGPLLPRLAPLSLKPLRRRHLAGIPGKYYRRKYRGWKSKLTGIGHLRLLRLLSFPSPLLSPSLPLLRPPILLFHPYLSSLPPPPISSV